MHFLIAIIVILLIIYLPQLWVRYVLNRYNQQTEPDFPGSGSELARHLLDRFELHDIKVESTDHGDHYDPEARAVRLNRDKFDGKTLTSITVATHECGHALQHAAGEPLFLLRSRLAVTAVWAGRLGSLLLFAAPFLALLTRAPSAAMINLLAAFLILGFGLLVQFITLPVELDASFNKALPILQSGYLKPHQIPAAKRILRAAAWTYVAASLASLLNFWRWLQLLRR